METVKAKIKGTNAILEGCVCDDSFFVSVDHDIFERYSLCEVEICKDSLQAQETCKENQNSFTSLKEAAEEYAYRGIPDEIKQNVKPIADEIIKQFIAGAEWQKEQMMKDAVEGEIGYWNQRGLSIQLDQSLERLGYDEDTKVKIIIVKQ